MNAPMANTGEVAGGRRGGGPGGLLGLFAPVFRRMIDRIDRGIEAGSLETTLPDGTRRMLGGRGAGPIAIVHLHSWRALLRLATGGSGGWYEAWARGEWTSPDPVQIFALFSRNRATLARGARASGYHLLVKRFAHWLRRNHRDGARRNIEYHYDLGNDFYAPWLDPGMSYSSAIFESPGQPLDAAQAAKLDAMLARTGTGPGDTILEIGCGWGSFAEAAGKAGRRLHGITLSKEQKAWAEARIAEQRIEGVDFALTDYRDVTGTYDAVVSIEMVEAVGREYWPHYLETISRVLKPGGRAAIQYIAFDDTLFEDYASNVDFIQTHIFPGGLLLSESQFRAIAQAKGLRWQDQANFGLSYAETLRQWRLNFDAAVGSGRLPECFRIQFHNLWRYYLMYCEGGFRGGGIDVAQVTLVKEG
ncbi:cyclopropane-fatty-acyl-phospholipid synthase family protein [Sphingomonas sp. LB-2]|uniref:SAM-dependent methyltransferase n=1 Tax=Sphingomonas caeni TaxID=2984949 RepID=UPI002231E18E|nr:cyclopropane-fatty-acyl-phospholipid synthase family protein [Sphingomonas caeni]MCW3847714.1 cyclopropane-fatty-acyl-phospholipid synthase family protein [Sphingomonas caeni]